MRFSRIIIAFVAVALVMLATSTTNGQEAASDSGMVEQTVDATPAAPFLTDLGTAKATAVQKDQNVLLDFYTDW